MKNIINSIVAVVALGAASLSAQTITGFGSGQYTTDFTDFTVTQTANTYQIVGTDFGSADYGLFAPVALTGYATATLQLSATLTSNVTSAFTIELYDAAGNIALYNGSWSSFTANTPGVATLTFGGATGAFDGTAVKLGLTTGGVGSALNATFDSLVSVPAVVVPEPSTYASLAGIAVLGFVAYRRRRVIA